MKKGMILFIKISVPVAVYLAVTSLAGALVPPLFRVDLSRLNPSDQRAAFTGQFTVALVQVLILTLVAFRSRLKKKRLALLISVLFFLINYLLNTMESLIFLRYIYPVGAQMVMLSIGLLISPAVGYSITWLKDFGSGRLADKAELSAGQSPIPKFLWSRKLILPWAGWTITWFVIYFFAGILIPMNVAGVSEYYFSSEGAMDMSLLPYGYLMQIPRAALWILAAIALQKYQRGSALEKSLITGIVFGTLMSSALLIPNPLMPPLVRMAHLPEIMYANLLWGVLISQMVSRKLIQPQD